MPSRQERPPHMRHQTTYFRTPGLCGTEKKNTDRFLIMAPDRNGKSYSNGKKIYNREKIE